MESNTPDGSIDARPCQDPGVVGSFEEDLDFASSPQATYVPKDINLTLGMTIAQVATSIKRLSNRLLRELGYPPFTFGLITNLRDRTITLKFPPDVVEVPHIFVYPMNHGRPSEKGFSKGADLGHIDLEPIERDGHDDRTRLHFFCNERDWPEYEGRLAQLATELGRSGHIEVEPSRAPTASNEDVVVEENVEPGMAERTDGSPPSVSQPMVPAEQLWSASFERRLEQLVAELEKRELTKGEPSEASTVNFEDLIVEVDVDPQMSQRTVELPGSTSQPEQPPEQLPRVPRRKGKGGPQYPPDEDMLQIVLCFEKVRGRENQNRYAKRFGISVSTLKRWRHELEERGLVTVTVKGVTSPIDGIDFDPESDCPKEVDQRRLGNLVVR